MAWWLSAWRSLNPISDSLGAECDGKGLWEKDVMEVVAHEVDERATLHLANSMAIRSYDQFGGQGLLPQDVFASRGVSGIDGTIATSLGESKGSGLKPMVVLLGDLTFLHDLGSLQLACETSAPITLLVMDNDGGGIFRFLPVAEGGDIFQKFFIKPHGLELSELVSGFGLATYEVFDRGSLESTLNQIIEAPGVKIVIAKVDGEVSILKHRVFFERSASRLTDAWEESVG